MGKWRNSEQPRWPLDNATLIPWLEKYVDHAEWVIELTGGEPSLYEGVEELMEWLSANGYRTIVKTNGTGNLPKFPNVKIVAAFHRLELPPQNYDTYLIVDRLHREEKEEYCRLHGISYKVIGYGKENHDNASHGFGLCAFVNPAGHQVGCQATPPHERIVKGVDYNRITHRPLVAQRCCPHCKAAIDAFRFL